jgi:hypothetical protein
MSGKSTGQVVSIGAMQLAAAMAIFLLPAAAWAQEESEKQGSELGLRFTPFLEQKLEARSVPAKLTAEDESVLAGKGYVKIGAIRNRRLIGKSSEGMAEALDGEILTGAASYGGDVVRLDKEGALVPYYVEKRKSTCADSDTHTTSRSETTMGVTREISTTTTVCTRWETTTVPDKTKKLDALISEGTVWRYDPKLAADLAATRAKRSADLAAIEPLLRDHPGWAHGGEYGGTPLHAASESGDKEAAEVLLAHGARINARDDDDWTPLHVAAKWGNKDVAEVLLAHGADINFWVGTSGTPLHEAAFYGRKDMVEWLIAHGADVNATT